MLVNYSHCSHHLPGVGDSPQVPRHGWQTTQTSAGLPGRLSPADHTCVVWVSEGFFGAQSARLYSGDNSVSLIQLRE